MTIKLITCLNEKEFIKLYKEGYSATAIANKFNVHKTTVLDHLRKCKIRIRQVKEAMEIGMASGKMEIVKHKIPKSSKKITVEKAYVLGVLCGDGWIWYKKGESYQIGLSCIDKEFRDKFRECLYKVYKIEPSNGIADRTKQNKNYSLQYVTRLCSKEACDDILIIGNFKCATWKVPPMIKEGSLNIQASFIQGFADSEGCVEERSRRIGLTSTNKEGLIEVQELLKNFKIDSNIQRTERRFEHHRDIYNLRIQDRESVEKYCRNIGFTIYRKQKHLENGIRAYKLHTTPHRKIIKSIPKMIVLRKKGLTYEQIGKELNIDYVTVWNNIRKYHERS